MHYRVVTPPDANAAQLLKDVRAWLACDPEMRKDRESPIRLCFGPRPRMSLFGAPRPADLAAGKYKYK